LSQCDQIISAINDSKFLIADFTGHRQGVYFEAGYALGQEKEVIWLCRESDISNTHFDTRLYNHIVWKDAEDLRKKLEDRIAAVIGRNRGK
jgi:nucleoside 2-deoxyribosyltransferase